MGKKRQGKVGRVTNTLSRYNNVYSYSVRKKPTMHLYGSKLIDKWINTWMYEHTVIPKKLYIILEWYFSVKTTNETSDLFKTLEWHSRLKWIR